MRNATKFFKTSSAMLAFAVVVAIAIAANVILGTVRVRKDLTEEKLYELSDGTREVLAKLPRPVVLKFFFSDDAQIPMDLKGYARRVEDLLKEYQLAGGGRVTIETYNPEPDSDAEEWAVKYGISGQSLGLVGPTLYLGLVAVSGDAEAALPVLNPQAEDRLEYDITRIVTRVANPAKPVLGVLSSLPVLGGPRMPYQMPGQPAPEPAWFAFSDLRQDYDVRRVDPAATEIGEEINALIVVHPKDLSDDTLYAIDQFVLRGGRLLAFMDPLCITEAEIQSPEMQTAYASKASTLGPLLDAWGVSYDPGKVVADLESASRLRTADNGIEESPVWLSLRENQINRDDVLTSHLEFLMLPFAGALKAQGSDDVKVTPLVSSSETSCEMDAMMAQFGSEGLKRSFKSGGTKLDLAVRLHGTFHSAFPDGKPGAAKQAKDDASASGTNDMDQAAAGDAQDGLKQSVQPTTIVLVADADLLYDRFCVQEIGFFGYKAHQPINDNLSFLANIVDQLAGSSALVSIRTRGKTERPFDVVLALQRKAQERYMEEEKRLQDKLSEAQQQLNELQSKKDDAQRFIVSPEQQKAIERFQNQVLETKQQLKLVRRGLRRDIENLGVKVKVINILLVPVCVALAGIWFGLYRRRKTLKK